jgi:Na+-transporting NADH:ubiquinone oxidoreductase subunit A
MRKSSMKILAKKVCFIECRRSKGSHPACRSLAFIKQRPYDIIATPSDSPRDIFVSAFYSAPLAPNFDFVVKGQENDFQTGLDALSKLTTGKVYVGIRKGSSLKLNGVELLKLKVLIQQLMLGVQINHIKPINKGEVVWTIC